jgi:hypothetical protein
MVQFRADDLDELVAEVDGIVDRATGREWITISPWVDPEHLPVVSVLRKLFTARGSKVPEATWVPPQNNEPAQLGFIHSRGANAYERLVDADVPIPPSWVKVSDHSKRGLLFAIHPDSPTREMIEFAIEASTELADVPTDDRWVAQVSTSGKSSS